MTPADTDPLRTLVAHVRARLDDAGMGQHADLVAALSQRRSTPPRVPGDGPPVLARLDDALAAARGVLPGEVGDALAAAAAGATWTRTAAYLEQPPGPGFLDGYAHATLVGPADGPPVRQGAPARPAAAVGLLLLGPDVEYPHHQHPADEVYLPLTPARWSHAEGDPYVAEPAGALLHHRPWQAHAMTTGDVPLLAVYLWTGDVVTPSAWC